MMHFMISIQDAIHKIQIFLAIRLQRELQDFHITGLNQLEKIRNRIGKFFSFQFIDALENIDNFCNHFNCDNDIIFIQIFFCLFCHFHMIVQ